MAISTLVGTVKVTLGIQASNTITGGDYVPLASNHTITKTLSYGTSVANAVANGADEAASFITSIAGAGNATIDVRALTDIMQTASVLLARVKALCFRLLSVADDATIGTAATFITIGNAGGNDFISTTGSGWFNSAVSVMDVPNGGILLFATPSAGGMVTAAGKKDIKIVNGDAAVTAKVQTTLFGGTT